MKIERSYKEYGSGSGQIIYNSDIFKVILWGRSNGVSTVIEFNNSFYHFKAIFDGKHELKSDDDCMDQLTTLEIIDYVRFCEEKSFKKGRNSMRKDFKSLMKDD